LDYLLPQLSGFIDRFNDVIKEFNVSVVTDSSGTMFVDVPMNMSDSKAKFVETKLGIIDKLINSHGDTINNIFAKGLKMEANAKMANPNYSSVLTDSIIEFKRLNASYKH
jgi:hypothetical protein